MEDAALAALDLDALARDAADLVRVPSTTGDERVAAELFAARADAAGLAAALHVHDLAALRAHPDHPGEEAARAELWGATATLEGSAPGRLALNGHIDVVGPGNEPWARDPFSGAIVGDRLHGRGSVDMKGAVIAALHALAALRRVGGRHARGRAAGRRRRRRTAGSGPSPPSNVTTPSTPRSCPSRPGCAWSARRRARLTFRGVVRGRSAHAAERLAGCSAIDRYVRVHLALAAHETAVNAAVTHPLMRELELPYPLLVGRVSGGDWSSQVPDRVEFEGRLGVPVGADLATARAALQTVVDSALDDGEPPCELVWEGGAFASAETPVDHPWVTTVRGALRDELGSEPALAGVPWGADMRLFTARGIPTVMVGTTGIELAHAVDESASLSELATVARTIIRAILRWEG